MTELRLSQRLAQIVVYGHLSLFVYGFFIMRFSTLEGADAAQLLLMGSPLLGLVAVAAFGFIMRGQAGDTSLQANPIKVQMAITVTGAFIVMLFVAYTTTLFNGTITANAIKFLVGGIETALGAYIGVVKDTFFPPAA